MNNLLKSFLKKTIFWRQSQYIESFDGEFLRRLCNNRNEHVYQKVYDSSTDFIKYFFESSRVGRLLKVHPSKRDEVLEIKCQFPDASEAHKLSDSYKSTYGVGFETYQKLYLDRGYHFPKNVIFKDLNGQLLFECNRFASIGHLSRNASNVNLIAGASETFQLVVRSQGATQDDGKNFLKLGFPFHEVNECISNAIEGGNLDSIVDSTNRLAKRLNEENIEIDIILGTFGWHNLIYNLSTEEYWRECLDEIKSNCKKLCILEIYSPILHLGNDDIIDFSKSTGKYFWGGLKPTIDNIENLRSAMLRFNNFLKEYSKSSDSVLVIPLNSLNPILDLENAMNYFIDINHINQSNKDVTSKIFDVVNAFLTENAKHFIPDVKKIPEYIYPLF